MKNLLLGGIAALSLGLGGAAVAQSTTMTHQHVTPNGAVHTTTRTETPYGTAATHTVERPDGTRTVKTRVRTDDTDDTDRYRHHAGYAYGHHRVCTTTWHHHHKVRTCTARHSHYT